jgi:two-component system, NtrC family, sensor kinase
MRLATKVSLGLMSGLLIALGVDGYVEIRRQIDVYNTRLQLDLRGQARTLAAAVGKLWSTFGDEGAAEVLEAANDRSVGTEARWISLRRLLDSDEVSSMSQEDLDELQEGRPIVREVLSRPDGARVVALSPVHVDLGMMGVVELGRPALDEWRFIGGRIARTMTTIAILALAAWVLAMVLGARFVGRPIAALVAKARRAGHGDFGTPLELKGKDELTELAGALNAMCRELGDNRERLDRETQGRLSAMKQLRRADRLTTVGRLAAGLAHELGTPLNVVKERVRMAAAGEVTDREAAANTQIIISELDRIAATIRQLLDFSRQHEPVKERCDLSHLVERTLALVQPIAEKAHVKVELTPADGQPLVEADIRQIEQVLTNLVINGIQAMPGGGTLRIGMGRRRPDTFPEGAERPVDAGSEHAFVSVEDQGEGIREADLPHIFEPFFTTKSIGEGTGLGLSVAHGIIEEHHGFITVDTKRDQGTRFTVYLPLGEAP